MRVKNKSNWSTGCPNLYRIEITGAIQCAERVHRIQSHVLGTNMLLGDKIIVPAPPHYCTANALKAVPYKLQFDMTKKIAIATIARPMA